MQNEDFLFLGKISSLNSLKKSGSEKKELVTLFLVAPLRGLLTTTIHNHA